jgi:hypothetical protein
MLQKEEGFSTLKKFQRSLQKIPVKIKLFRSKSKTMNIIIV